MARADESKKQGKVPALRIEGTVVLISKDSSRITLQQPGNVRRTILYDEKTKFTFRNKPASIDQLKEGIRVICLGKENDNKELLATRVDIRSEK
jgi:hypothetical protein